MALHIREMNNLVYPILILCTVLAFYQLITNIKISLRWSVSAHMLKDARDAGGNYNCHFSNIQGDKHTSSFIVLVMWQSWAGKHHFRTHWLSTPYSDIFFIYCHQCLNSKLYPYSCPSIKHLQYFHANLHVKVFTYLTHTHTNLKKP